MYLKPRLLPLAPQISVDYVQISSALNRLDDFFFCTLAESDMTQRNY